MNSKILEHYESIISTTLEYLSDNSIRSSLEAYKMGLLLETEKLTNQDDKNHNIEFINSFYAESIDALNDNEVEMNATIDQVVSHFKNNEKEKLTELIAKQIKSSLEDFKIKSAYSDFNGLFFEYDDDVEFSGFGFKETKFEIILETPKQIEFEDGDYVSETSIDFRLPEFLSSLKSEAYEEVAWVFEYELDIFLKIKEMYYAQVAICLNQVLSSKPIIETLEKNGFTKGGIAYLNEHDLDVKTVYVNN